jgi:hypothetical protein
MQSDDCITIYLYAIYKIIVGMECDIEMKNSQLCPQLCRLSDSHRQLSQSSSVRIRAHDDDTIEAQIEVGQGSYLSVFAERCSSNKWMISFWKSTTLCAKQCSAEREFIQNYFENYTFLFSACLEAVSLSSSDPNLNEQITISSHDCWIAENFLDQWRKQVNKKQVLVQT